MQNKTYILWIFLILIAPLVSSCGDVLDLKPSGEIDEDKAFETIDDLEQGVKGVYNQLGGSGVIELSSRASDDVRISTQNRGQGVQVHNWTYNESTDEAQDYWQDFYFTIDRANRILEVANTFDQEDEQVKQYIGEMLFMRAFCHFELMRTYTKNYASNDPKGIPYLFNSMISSPSRLSQSDVYQNILTDIASAEALLMDREIASNRANYYAVMALRANVALYQQDWDAAIAATNTIINESGIRLAEYDEVADLWNDASNEDVEVLLKQSRVGTDGRIGSLFTDPSNGDIYFAPGIDLMSKYDSNDIRLSVYFGMNERGDDVVAKHDGRADDSPNLVDYKIYRISEMYLIRAEAYIKKSMLTEAAADLDAIRIRRNLSAIALSFTSVEQALEILQLERRLELAYEGHRFYDIKRWELSIERIPEDAEYASASTLEAGDYRFIFPIPQHEMFANKNMIQNDGYIR